MILPIYNLAYDVQDFERLGNYLNYQFGLQECPDKYLFPFKCPNIPHSSNSISTFSLRRVEISGGTKIIIETTALDTALIQISSGTTFDYYYFEALTEIADGLVGGVYEYYIKDNNNTEFISELFCYVGSSQSVYPQPTIQTLTYEDEEQILTEDNNLLIQE